MGKLFAILKKCANVGGGIGDKCQLWAANVKKTTMINKKVKMKMKLTDDREQWVM